MTNKITEEMLNQVSKFEKIYTPFIGDRLFLLSGRFYGGEYIYDHQITQNYWTIWIASRNETIKELKRRKVKNDK